MENRESQKLRQSGVFRPRRVSLALDDSGNLIGVYGSPLSVEEAEKVGKALLQHAIQKSLEKGEDPFED